MFQRPAPLVPDDDELVLLRLQQRATRIAAWRTRGFSHAELRALATHTRTFTHVAGWLAHDAVLNPGDSIGPRGVVAQFVTPNYFAALGVPLAAGPGFTQDASGIQSQDESDLAAVMSFIIAERLFGTATNAIGRRVLVNDMPVRVVGLAPRGFQGALRDMNSGQTALWIPVSARADIARVPARWLTDDASMEVFGRLAPGASREEAAAITQLVVARSLPDSASRVGMSRTAQVFSLHALLPESRDSIVIFGALGIVRTAPAAGDVHQRQLAHGGRRGRTPTRDRGAPLARRLTRAHSATVAHRVHHARGRRRGGRTHALLVAAEIGVWALRQRRRIRRHARRTYARLDHGDRHWDRHRLRSLSSTARHADRSGTALRDSGTGASRQSRLQSGFVVAQIVFSLPLLVMLGTTLSLIVADYEPLRPELSERVVRVTFAPLQHTGPPGQRRDAVDSLIPRLAAHPDITGVVPEASHFDNRRVRKSAPAKAAAGDSSYGTLKVFGAAPGWFALLDIPILMGRDVALADTAERDWPVVIGSDLARALWDGASPIGRTLASIEGRDSISMTVVGVYDATHTRTVGKDSISVFTAHGKEWRRDALLVRTRGDAEALLPVLRPMIRDLAPGLPVIGMRTLASADEEDRADTITMGSLVGAGGLLALLLASLGLYGVIALAVRQRTREIGIRIALGAEPLRVARMFLASGVRLGVIALVIGLLPSIAALRFLLSRFAGLAPRVDAWAVGAGVAAALLVVVAGASWLPARRAAAVDPASTLRVE
jgi:hypothetical protein